MSKFPVTFYLLICLAVTALVLWYTFSPLISQLFAGLTF